MRRKRLADAKAGAEESFAEAEQQPDARADADKGWQELSDGQEEFDAENSRRRMVLRKREMKLPRESSRLPMAAHCWMQRSSSFGRRGAGGIR